MKIVVALAVASLLPVAEGAHAQSIERKVACATTNQTSEKAICAWEEYRGDSVWIARAISRALVMLDGIQNAEDPNIPSNARDLLIASQESWELYRDTTCELETSLAFGGEGTPLTYATCLRRLTAARVNDLKVLLQEDE